MTVNLGILASHEGSNAQALIDACRDGTLPADPVVIISNNERSGVLRRAGQEGIAALHLSRRTHPVAEALDAAIRDALLSHRVNWVALAGYMRPVGAAVLSAYRQRVVNIHPGPLPRFGGAGMYDRSVHSAVLEAGLTETRVTVHRVTPEYDLGAVIAELPVPVLPGDTPDTLRERVQHAERGFYARVLARLIHDEP